MNFENKSQLVKEVQEALNIPTDGIDGEQTWHAIVGGILDKQDKTGLVKCLQRILKVDDDGLDGPKTWGAIIDLLVPKEIPAAPATGETGDLPLSQKAFDLIIKHEVGGGAPYYNKALKRPCWPGGASGVTIGVGYDLGYNDLAQFTKDWKGVIPDGDFDRLAKTLGKKSDTAKAAVAAVKDIEISWESALAVFIKSTLPRFIKLTISAFPGSEKLKADAFGSLVSLVFNRGGSTSGGSRAEMLNIKNAIVQGKSDIYGYIADEIQGMKRLWVGKGLDGLLRRRDEEAALVKSCA